jgi:hypothetical protein
MHQILPGSQVSFGSLNRGVPQQQLDLLQLPASSAAHFRAAAPQIMRSDSRNTCGHRVRLEELPHNLLRHSLPLGLDTVRPASRSRNVLNTASIAAVLREANGRGSADCFRSMTGPAGGNRSISAVHLIANRSPPTSKMILSMVTSSAADGFRISTTRCAGAMETRRPCRSYSSVITVRPYGKRAAFLRSDGEQLLAEMKNAGADFVAHGSGTQHLAANLKRKEAGRARWRERLHGNC